MKFEINEKALANGILAGDGMLEKVRENRPKLTENVDYIMSTLGVMYSTEGVTKMVALLSLDSSHKTKLPEKVETATQTLLHGLGTIEKRRVTKLKPFTGNKKYMGAQDEKTGEELTVHVRDNTNFTTNMTIEVVKGFAGSWDYLGPMPRSRGRM